MRNMIARYMMNLKIDDIKNFSINKGVSLTDEELKFTYDFVKKNWEDFMSNPKLFNIDRYKSNYSADTFSKIKKVYNEYLQTFSNYL